MLFLDAGHSTLRDLGSELGLRSVSVGRYTQWAGGCSRVDAPRYERAHSRPPDASSSKLPSFRKPMETLNHDAKSPCKSRAEVAKKWQMSQEQVGGNAAQASSG